MTTKTTDDQLQGETLDQSVERLLRQVIETPAGERIRMKCGAADLRSVITDLLDTRAAVTGPRGDVERRRLQIALRYIKRAANRELPKLPCRVDEMTEREVAIFNVGAAAVGNLQFIARELDALPDAATSSPAPAESWSKEFPKADGVYWLRFADPESQACIVEVVRSVVFQTGVVGDIRNRVEIAECEWLGPITPHDPATRRVRAET